MILFMTFFKIMTKPSGFEDSLHHDHVFAIGKTIYGLKYALGLCLLASVPNCWNGC
jgi:hypothetical protein